jgi:hypothetical protein
MRKKLGFCVLSILMMMLSTEGKLCVFQISASINSGALVSHATVILGVGMTVYGVALT